MSDPKSKVEESSLFKGVFYSIEEELVYLEKNFLFKNLIFSEFAKLEEVLSFLWKSGGKRLRPALVLLCSMLSNKEPKIKQEHYTLATATELLHTASLIHDDLIDSSIERRGQSSLYQEIGSKSAVLVGDYLFSQASYKISSLENLEINKAYARTLSELCLGELKQAKILFKINESLKTYLRKSKYKTASLFSTGTFSAGILNQSPSRIVLQNQAQLLGFFGNYLGLAFQITDDLIDFGKFKAKPSVKDISSGILNIPVTFALREQGYRKEITLILRKLGYQENSKLSLQEQPQEIENSLLEKLLFLLEESKSLEKTRVLAKAYADKARKVLQLFPESVYKKNLLELNYSILERNF